MAAFVEPGLVDRLPRGAGSPLGAGTIPPAPLLGKVAYIAGGDVWVVDLDTDQHTRLTRDGRNRRPRRSADGRWIAYQKDDRLWIVEVGTGKEWPVSETPVSEFAWSPGENRLAYLSAAGGLVIWETEQSTQTLVESKGGFTLVRFAWDPTDRWLAYESAGAEWGLHKVSLDRASFILYKTSDLSQAPRLANWSVDSGWLVIWMGPASASAWADGLPLCLIPAGGGAPRCLEQKILLHPDWLSWSPDGRLALIAGGGERNLGQQGAGAGGPGLTGRLVVRRPCRTGPNPTGLFPRWRASGL